MAQRWQVVEGDAVSGLATFDPETFHTVVTSPPYYGLRDYQTGGSSWPAVSYEAIPGAQVEVDPWEGELGHERTPAAFNPACTASTGVAERNRNRVASGIVGGLRPPLLGPMMKRKTIPLTCMVCALEFRQLLAAYDEDVPVDCPLCGAIDCQRVAKWSVGMGTPTNDE